MSKSPLTIPEGHFYCPICGDRLELYLCNDIRTFSVECPKCAKRLTYSIYDASNFTESIKYCFMQYCTERLQQAFCERYPFKDFERLL